jgi:hypothetical protein
LHHSSRTNPWASFLQSDHSGTLRPTTNFSIALWIPTHPHFLLSKTQWSPLWLVVNR